MTRIALSDHDENFRSQVESGNYDDEGEVVSAGLRMLEELEEAREKWLSQELPSRFEQLRSDPASGLSLSEAFAGLEARHQARLAGRK